MQDPGIPADCWDLSPLDPGILRLGSLLGSEDVYNNAPFKIINQKKHDGKKKVSGYRVSYCVSRENCTYSLIVEEESKEINRYTRNPLEYFIILLFVYL